VRVNVADRWDVEQVMGGDPTFEEAFDDLFRVAYQVAFRLTGSREMSEDLAQEALARAAVRWGRVRGFGPAWVSRVVSNLALDVLRRKRPAVAAAEVVDFDSASAARIDLVAALRRLPRRQREVETLRYVADLDERQVAAALGCTVGTVKQHASRGLAALRSAVETMEGDPSVRLA
jgi:RNA polymerase sigma factor (sigma-70 family)